MGSKYVVTGGSFISEDELCHYGIKGMRWGVRKYQNYDGSYTKAGLKRYNAAMDSYDKRLSEYKTAKLVASLAMRLDLRRLKLRKLSVT